MIEKLDDAGRRNEPYEKKEPVPFFSSHKDQENVVGANGEVEEEDTYDDSSCDGQTLVNTKEDKAEHC